MPAPITTTLLVFGAILTVVSGPAGVIVAGVGLLVEAFLFLSDGVG